MRIVVTVALCGLLAAPLVVAGTYSGEWEYQALNSGDTNFQVKHEGGKITFYRVLYPLYQGKKFKLEHLYKGKLDKGKIQGQMWVREEGVEDFERLRPFDGLIKSADRMLMDDLPLERVGAAPPFRTPPAEKAPAAAEPERPKYAKVIIAPDARKDPAPPPAAEPEDPAPPVGAKPARTAPIAIPTLVPVKRRLRTEVRRRADGLLRAGDTGYAGKDYGLAVERYKAAFDLDPRRVELLYKLGLCHGILGSKALRTGDNTAAGAHYRLAIVFWSRAVRLDPYNAGAKENIRRAESKLAGLE